MTRHMDRGGLRSVGYENDSMAIWHVLKLDLNLFIIYNTECNRQYNVQLITNILYCSYEPLHDFTRRCSKKSLSDFSGGQTVLYYCIP